MRAAQAQPRVFDAPNVARMLELRAQQRPDAKAVHVKDSGRWEALTWAEFLRRVQVLSAALVAEGVKAGERVAVFGATSLTWLIADFAISGAGAITVPIYASNTPDECRYILNNSGAVALFVDNDVAEGKQEGRATRIRKRLDECPTVRQVILFEGSPTSPREVTLASLREKGEAAHQAKPGAFSERIARIGRDEACCFIYTSGTTGDPKGVILTHGNWTFEAQALEELKVLAGDESVILFLPLAHVFAQVVKSAWVGAGYELIIAESTDKLLANIAETKPTVVPSVPRVFEKVYAGVVQNGMSAPGVKGRLFKWAMGLFDEYVEAKLAGREYSSLSFTLAQRLVFAKASAALKEKLGGRIRLFISGGAPLSRRIGYFFQLLGFEVLEGYGLTETAAGTTVARPGQVKIGSVGPALPGVELKIADDGEVLIRGPHVMKGYYRNDEATKEAIDAERWFHSGDIGEIDPEGFLFITDRKKDIIVTAGGKNIAPQNLENALKTVPIMSQVMVHGDKRPYLSALICVSEEVARKLVPGAKDYAELSRSAAVRADVQKAIDAFNAEQPPYQTIKKFALMDHDFTQESGELTPTLKVKRKLCTQRYKAMLDAMYDGAVHD